MGVQQSIPAVYEDGVFKPLEPVYGVTEHAQVHLIIQTEEVMAQQIAESERLARESLEGLNSRTACHHCRRCFGSGALL